MELNAVEFTALDFGIGVNDRPLLQTSIACINGLTSAGVTGTIRGVIMVVLQWISRVRELLSGSRHGESPPGPITIVG